MSKDLNQLLQELHQEYLRSLPQKIGKLKELHHNHDHVSLRDEFHKLKGTGKTYGFPEITELGSAMERRLLEFIAHGSPAPETKLIDAMVGRSLRVLEKIYASHTQPNHSPVDQDADYIQICGRR